MFSNIVVVVRRGSLFKLYKNLVCREAESQIVGGGKVGDEKFCQPGNICSPPTD